MSVSDQVKFKTDGTEVVLMLDGEEHYRADALDEGRAREFAEQYERCLDEADTSGRTAEDVARSAVVSMMFNVGLASATEYAAQAAENCSKQVL